MEIHELNTKTLTSPAYVALDDGTDTYKLDLNAKLSTMQSSISGAESNISTLQDDVEDLQENPVIYHGECSTSASSTTKTVSVIGFDGKEGDLLVVRFINGNTANSFQMNVSSTGARNTLFFNDTSALEITPNSEILFEVVEVATDTLGYYFVGLYPKQKFEEIDSELSDLNNAISHLDGLSEEVKLALLQIASKVAYIDEDGQDYYDDLYDALYPPTPPATLVSISAVYTQSGTVYTTDTLDSLKADLVVTALYEDSSSAVVTTYTLSGTLTAGTSTITVSYGGKTTTFTVTVTHDSGLPAGYTAVDYIQSSGGAYIDTGIKELYGTIAGFWGIFKANIVSTNVKSLFGYQGKSSGQVSTFRFDLRVTTDNELKYYGAASGISDAISGWDSNGANEISVSLIANQSYPIFEVNDIQSVGNKTKTTYLRSDIGSIYLMAENYQAGGPGASDLAVDGSTLKCYGFKINNIGGTVRNYVPCIRNADSVAGFYDFISETFYPSIGENQFTSGNDEV